MSHYFSPLGQRGEPEASIGPPQIASALNAPLCGVKHLVFFNIKGLLILYENLRLRYEYKIQLEGKNDRHYRL